MKSNPETKIGCCGFALAQPNYFEIFKLIEVQITFYQLPRLKTAEKWRDTAPEHFEFTMKAWQLITHESSSPTYRRLGKKIEASKQKNYGRFQCTDEVFEAWDQTAHFAKALGATIILFQCPARFRPTRQNIANMQAFFGEIEREGYRLAWEPRGAWPQDLVYGLCEEFKLIHCVDPFKNAPLHGDLLYFRLHGMAGFDSQYKDSELRQLKKWVLEKPAYALFNNRWMVDDALRFSKLMTDGDSVL